MSPQVHTDTDQVHKVMKTNVKYEKLWNFGRYGWKENGNCRENS